MAKQTKSKVVRVLAAQLTEARQRWATSVDETRRIETECQTLERSIKAATDALARAPKPANRLVRLTKQANTDKLQATGKDVTTTNIPS